MINDYIYDDNNNKKTLDVNNHKLNLLNSISNNSQSGEIKKMKLNRNLPKDNNYINNYENIGSFNREKNLNRNNSNFNKEFNIYNFDENIDESKNKMFYSPNNNIDDKYISNFNKYYKNKDNIENKNRNSTYEYLSSNNSFYNKRKHYNKY